MSQAMKDLLEARLEDRVISQIAGNAPREIKEMPVKWLALFRGPNVNFAHSVSMGVKVVEVSVLKNPEDPLTTVGRVVCEKDVTEGMVDKEGNMHGGCLIFLVDECSMCALVVWNVAEGRPSPPGISQVINTIFHNPAKLGTKLRIVSTSFAAMTCKAEIWDVENHRLVASGEQLQMKPLKPHVWVAARLE